MNIKITDVTIESYFILVISEKFIDQIYYEVLLYVSDILVVFVFEKIHILYLIRCWVESPFVILSDL